MISIPVAFEGNYVEKGAGMSGYVIGYIAHKSEAEYVIYLNDRADWSVVSVDAPDKCVMVHEWIDSIVAADSLSCKAEELAHQVISSVEQTAKSFEEGQQLIKALIEYLDERYLE